VGQGFVTESTSVLVIRTKDQEDGEEFQFPTLQFPARIENECDTTGDAYANDNSRIDGVLNTMWSICFQNQYDYTPFLPQSIVKTHIWLSSHCFAVGDPSIRKWKYTFGDNVAMQLRNDALYAPQSMLIELGLASGSLVTVQRQGTADRARVFRILPTQWTFHCMISPIGAYHLHFNLSGMRSMHLGPVSVLPAYRIKLNEAEHIRLDLLYDQNYDKGYILDLAFNELVRWAQEENIIQVNDVFPIKVRIGDIPQAQLLSTKVPTPSNPHFNHTGSNSHILLYFKVGKITPSGESSYITSFRSRITHEKTISFPMPPIPNLCFRKSHDSQLRFRLLGLLDSRGLPCPGSSTLVHGKSGVGKTFQICSLCQDFGIAIFKIDCQFLLKASEESSLTSKLAYAQSRMLNSKGIILLLHLDALFNAGGNGILQARKLEKAFQASKVPIFATSEDITRIPADLKSFFTYFINLRIPGDNERINIINSISNMENISLLMNASALSKKLQACTPKDIAYLLRYAQSEAYFALPHNTPVHAFVRWNDIDKALMALHANNPKLKSRSNANIAKVQWEDVGGLLQVKDEILKTIQLPMNHPKLFSSGLQKRSGILLYGPPGTGKTLVAKAVATEFNLQFINIKGPELLSMFIGESEGNIRKIFQKAKDAAPSVLFFDELDSIAPERGDKGDGAGVMDRIVSQLLIELDSLSDGGTSPIFVMGATNRPDLLDKALLRPGRFDKVVFLDVPHTFAERLHILNAVTRKMPLDQQLDLTQVVEVLPKCLTGADLFSLTNSAMLLAVSRYIQLEEPKFKKKGRSPSHIEPHICITLQDFVNASTTLQPSTTMEELNRYRALEGRLNMKRIHGASSES
jgi:AAA+ superfamily predicted ATPase